MVRIAAVLLGPLLLAAAPARDWGAVTTRTAAGAYVTGNPQARVRLVEYGSYTCPHCAAFATESAAVLRGQMIRSGSTSLEYRHLVRDGLDLGAVILARCAGPQRFAQTSAYVFATQNQWLQRGYEFQQVNAQRIALYPKLAQVRALADGAGLTQLIEARGLSPAAVDACFADEGEVNRILAASADLPAGVDGTPAFFVNGRLVPHVGWADLQPQLRAAGAH